MGPRGEHIAIICLYTHRLIQRSVLINHKWHISVTALLRQALENVTEEGWEDPKSCGALRKTMLQGLLDNREGLLHSQTTVTRSSQSALQQRMKRALQGPTPKLRKGEAGTWPVQLQFSNMVTCNLQERNSSKNRARNQKLFPLPNLQQVHSQNCSLRSWPQLAIVYLFFSLPNVSK